MIFIALLFVRFGSFPLEYTEARKGLLVPQKASLEDVATFTGKRTESPAARLSAIRQYTTRELYTLHLKSSEPTIVNGPYATAYERTS